MAARKNVTEEVGTLGALLRLPYQMLSERLYAELAETYPDIRPAHGVIFRYLPSTGARVTDLAERAQMTKQSMAYLTDYLQTAGYLQLLPDPTDGRAKIVQFTAKGNECLNLALTLSARIEAAAAVQMPDGDMTQLRTLLQRLGDALESLPK